MLSTKYSTPPKQKKRKEPLRLGNLILIVVSVIAITSSLIMVEPNHPVPKISQEDYQTFLDRCNSILTGTSNSTVVNSAEVNSFFHAQVLNPLLHEREYIGHPDPITFRHAYLDRGKVVLVIHYQNKKYPILKKDIYIRGNVIVTQGRLIFKSSTMSCGLLYLPAVIAKHLMHQLEIRFLANMKIPQAFKKVIIKENEAYIYRNT